MKTPGRLDDWARGHFRLLLAAVAILQVIALIALLSDAGAPLLLYQNF